jgi:hypothetical protein
MEVAFGKPLILIFLHFINNYYENRAHTQKNITIFYFGTRGLASDRRKINGWRCGNINRLLYRGINLLKY